MYCCNQCPLNPLNTLSKVCCPQPECHLVPNFDHQCNRLPFTRCYMDKYVANRLYQKDALAQKLAPLVLQKAILGRDRPVVLALFHAASRNLRLQFWEALKNYEPRSIWLLNPVFTAAGLLPLESFSQFSDRQNHYLNALLSNPYVGGTYEPVCQTSINREIKS